jgi:hypothetical protein
MSNHLHCIALPCSAQHHSFFLSTSDDKRANLNEYQKAFLSVAHPAHTSPGAKQLKPTLLRIVEQLHAWNKTSQILETTDRERCNRRWCDRVTIYTYRVCRLKAAALHYLTPVRYPVLETTSANPRIIAC